MINIKLAIFKLFKYRLLPIILHLLHDHENSRNRVSALEIITGLAFRFSKQFLNGFVATDIDSLMQEKNNEVRKKAHQSFIALLSLFDKKFVSKKFFGAVKRMAEDLNSDIRLIFADSICIFAKKLPFDVFENEVLPKFISHLDSKHRFIKEKSLTMLGNLICTINEIFIRRKVTSEVQSRERSSSKLIAIPNALYGSRTSSTSQKGADEEDEFYLGLIYKY